MIKPQAAHNDNHYPDQDHSDGLFHKSRRTMPNAPNLIYAEAKRKPAYETQTQRVGWSAFLLMSSPSNEAGGRQSLGNPSENSISDFLPRRPPRYPTIASRANRVASGPSSRLLLYI